MTALTTTEKIALAVIVALAVLIGGRCYGDARAKAAVQLAVAHADDSVSKADAAKATVLENAAKLATARAAQLASQAKANAARADSALAVAEARGDAAEKESQALDTMTLAPTARRVFANLQLAYLGLERAADSVKAANVELRIALGTDSVAIRSLWAALAADSTTITEQRAAITAYQKVKTPSPHTLLHVAVGVGLFLLGAAAGHGI